MDNNPIIEYLKTYMKGMEAVPDSQLEDKNQEMAFSVSKASIPTIKQKWDEQGSALQEDSDTLETENQAGRNRVIVNVVRPKETRQDDPATIRQRSIIFSANSKEPEGYEG
ncbi:hypothetical protein [Flavihumibacter sp. UBA7668]|uniref:hypothetical protein n=1 Tax=Flavihumibacter sp. UBA7668 TaxID=1946542 RepID=UPI0025C64AC1|nr:hypothetical protein [Flavihumibacter sp. UBA7668]